MATISRPRLASAIQRRRASPRAIALATVVLANVLWAGTYTAGKIALGELSPVELNALRFTLATLVLAPVLWRQRARIPRDRRSLALLAQLVLLGFVLNKGFEYFGLSLSTASDVALLISTESLFTALLSWTLLRERASRASVAALVVGMIGVYLVVERGWQPNLGGGGTRVLGDVLVIFSLLMEAGYTIRGKTVLSRIPPLLFVAVTLMGSLFVWVPAGAIAVVHSGLPHMSVAGWLAVGYMALVATVAGYWLWFRALTVLDGAEAAPMLFIQPLLGAALAIWLLGDTLSWATVAGAILILTSLAVVVGMGRRPRTAVAVAEAVP